MDKLGEEEWERTVVVIDRLTVLGSLARMPLSKSPGDRVFELRFTLGPTARRMTIKLIESSQQRWRAVNGPDLVALVRAGATFEKGVLVERPNQLDQEAAA